MLEARRGSPLPQSQKSSLVDLSVQPIELQATYRKAEKLGLLFGRSTLNSGAVITGKELSRMMIFAGL